MKVPGDAQHILTFAMLLAGSLTLAATTPDNDGSTEKTKKYERNLRIFEHTGGRRYATPTAPKRHRKVKSREPTSAQSSSIDTMSTTTTESESPADYTMQKSGTEGYSSPTGISGSPEESRSGRPTYAMFSLELDEKLDSLEKIVDAISVSPGDSKMTESSESDKQVVGPMENQIPRNLLTASEVSPSLPIDIPPRDSQAMNISTQSKSFGSVPSANIYIDPQRLDRERQRYSNSCYGNSLDETRKTASK